MRAAVLEVNAAAERAMMLPVFAGLAAMVATAILLAWLQWRRHRQPTGVELPPRCEHEPRSHVATRTPLYDWSRHDCWPAR